MPVDVTAPIASPDAVLAPGEAMTVTLAPSPNSTPETDPRMTVHVRLYDEATGAPVVGDIYWIPGEKREPDFVDLRGVGVIGIDLLLFSEAAGWLVVDVPGYEMWSVELKYSIKTSRVLDVPVRLKVHSEGA